MVDMICILGPTASGKTSIAVEAARELDGEIISADSRQVYRGMDIGTGKDISEYGMGEDAVPFHLIDIVDPSYEFNLYEFQQRFLRSYEDIKSRGKLPILCGGTGLYLDSVLRAYELSEAPPDPDLREELTSLPDKDLVERLKFQRPLHNTTDTESRERMIRAIEIAESGEDPIQHFPHISSLVFATNLPREELRHRIELRLKERLKDGMIDEAAALHENGVSYERMEQLGLEYRFLALHLKGELTRNDMFQKLRSAIVKFSKRQSTWFRRMEKNGVKINWLNPDASREEAVREIVTSYRRLSPSSA